MQVVAKITNALIDKPGYSIGRQDIAQGLLEIRKQSMIDNVFAPIGSIAKPSNTTIRNYTALAASQSNIAELAPVK